MFKKGTKLYSIFNGKCPNCHEGAFFRYGITFHPTKVTELHENCPNCNFKYMMEPSFFYGAMYVNYGITVAVSITAFLIAKLGFNLNLLNSFLIVVAILVISAPINLRLARILWINMFVNYKEKDKKKD